MRVLSDKWVVIDKVADVYQWRQVTGPILPRFCCMKMKGNLVRLQWEVNINDPRYEVLNAVLALTPNETHHSASGIRPPRTIPNRWKISLEEYRDLCGREGPLKD